MRSSHTWKRVGLALTLAASFAASVVVEAHLPLRPKPYPRLLRAPDIAVPDDDSFFVATVGDELSQAVLYHDLGDSIAHARQADILVLGDSRAQMGLREDVIVPEARKLGLRVFSLACGHAEGMRFPLEVIRKHDLRPKIVLAVGGQHIWDDSVSGPARRAMAQTRWDAWKAWIEGRAAWSFQLWLHRYLPRIDFFDQDLTAGWVTYRSPATGWWRTPLQPSGKYPIRAITEDRGPYDRLFGLARELKHELDSRHAQLVLGIVPYRDTRAGYLPDLARDLGVPTVVPSFADLFTSDSSHLVPESAERYSHEFWSRFISLPEVRQRLGLSSDAI